MSRFTKPSMEWAKMGKLVPSDQKAQFMLFKAKADGYLRRVFSNPAEPPKIDWEAYKKIVPMPGLVDKFKQEYEAFKVPYPPDNVSSQIDSQWSKLQGEIKSFVAARQKDIEGANKELSRINALPKFEEMTMELFHDMYPDDALNTVKKPSFWPHNPEEQLGYVPPENKVDAKK